MGFKKENIPWNKGLTKENNNILLEISRKVKKSLKGRKLSEDHKRNIGLAGRGRHHSEETKKRIGLKQKGKIISRETKDKIKEARKKQIITEDHKKNISKALKGRVSPMKGKIGHMLGKHHTKEAKQKIKLARMRQVSPMKGRNQTKEAKQKISIANKGRHHTRETIVEMKKRRMKQIFPIKDTTIEVKVQNLLKQLGIEFATHQYMKIKYGYQCDIFIPVQEGISQKTVIECDGDYWHGNLEIYPINKLSQGIKNKRCLDYERTAQLEEAGFRVIRLWEHKIRAMELNDIQEVLVK